MAVSYYKTLLEEKKQAKEFLREPRPRKLKRSEQVALKEKKKEAKQILRKSLQKEVEEKHPCLKGSQICKWFKRCMAERWEDIPDAIRKRSFTTGNTWCSKVGLSLRGRQQGGSYPWALQKELDVLIGEMSLGASSISERREVVTAECIAPWFFFTYMEHDKCIHFQSLIGARYLIPKHQVPCIQIPFA